MTYYTPLSRPASKPSDYPCYMAITLRLGDTSSDLLVRHVRLLRDCVALAQKRWGFVIEAAAVLPSELQLLCLFPNADMGAGGAMRLITTAFDHHVPRHDASVWANNSETIEIPAAVVPLRRTFVEAAPVRAGLVKVARDWPYSSAHSDTAQSSDLGVAVA